MGQVQNSSRLSCIYFGEVYKGKHTFDFLEPRTGPAQEMVKGGWPVSSSIGSRTVIVALSAIFCGVPALAASDGPVKLLYNNDLDLTTVNQHRSVLLLPSQNHQSSSRACGTFQEALLTVNKTAFLADISPTLQYEIFLKTFPQSQLFWVGSQGSGCQAIDVTGRVQSVPCSRSLPALCTQTAGPTASPDGNLLVQTTSQDLTVTGFRNQRSFRFLGIPYANKPERFTYSTPFTGSRTINATRFGSQCVQVGVPSGSEDCLFLNIFTPLLPRAPLPKSELKAVMFWIHGGAFTGGTGSDPTFDGGNMASRGDVVVVTINYRLSTLGFLALADGKTNGNFGFADQILALDWVREHISAFGGDPDRITVFGQSAGAASVRALLASPKAFGKFAAAIPMSNLAGSNFASTYSFYFTIPEEVSLAVNPILSETGCKNAVDQLACLREFDAQALISLPDTAKFLVVDGTFLTSTQLPLNGSGPVANVHTMSGFMRDDGAAFIGFPSSANISQALAQDFLPQNVTGNSLFPVPAGSNGTLNAFNVTARVTTDVEFRCLDQATVIAGVQHNLFKSTWFYEFNRSYQTAPGFDPNFPTCEAPIDAAHPLGDTSQEYFKCHSGELFYVFGTLPSTSTRPYRDDQDLPFMRQMLDTWTSFARTFNPNPDPGFLRARGFTDVAEHFAKQSKWEKVTKSNLQKAPMRQLQFDSFMVPFKDADQCSFLGFPLNFFT